MAKAIDLTGRRFGRLVVLRRAADLSPRNPRWECKCDCGNVAFAQGASLRSGGQLSCGCYQKQVATRHGMEGTKTYTAWAQMKARCLNPRHKSYPGYGGRGITVCGRWMTFGPFFSDMGAAPAGTSLERIDNERGYEPGNCRWASIDEQNSNRRGLRIIEYEGRKQTAAAWAREYGISPITLRTRLRMGWPIERALTAEVDEAKATKKPRSHRQGT